MGDDCDCLDPTISIPPPDFHKEQKEIKNTYTLPFPFKWEIKKLQADFFSKWGNK